MNNVKCTVIVPAAGQGKRFGGEIPKQFLELNGIPIIIHTLKIFDEVDEIQNIVIPVDSDYKKILTDLVKKYGIKKKITTVKGGKERQNSIFNTLKTEAIEKADIILVHDAVRPFASVNLIFQIIKAAKRFGAAIPGILSKDTIKSLLIRNFVDETLPRENLRNIQTPQGFRKDIFIEMYRSLKKNDKIVTDDSSLAEMLGVNVKIIEGEEQNIKITTQQDMLLAQAIISLKNRK